MAIDTTQALTVLIVERHKTVSQSLASIVRELGNAEVVAEARSQREALSIGESLAPDVAIVDLELSPNCSLLSKFQEISPATRILVLADRHSSDPQSLVDALAAGAVGAIYRDEATDRDLLSALRATTPGRPVVAEEAWSLLLGSYVDSLQEKRRRDVAIIQTLAGAVEARDVGTGIHLRSVTQLACQTMETIDEGLAANEEVRFGFMLHDVGKIGVPDLILNKPGPLDAGEWEVMRSHPELGVKIVEPIGFSSTTTDIILNHHERWDGEGYPRGLRGLEIPLAARAFSVADAFDAMTSTRPYRPAMPEAQAIDTIRVQRNRAFDPDVVDAFLGQYL